MIFHENKMMKNIIANTAKVAVFTAVLSTVLMNKSVKADETLTLSIPDGYTNGSSYSKVYIDGSQKTVSKDDATNTVSVILSDDEVATSKTAIMYKYDDSDIPVGMTVWSIDKETLTDEATGEETTSIKGTKLDNFTDILKYLGFSVRVTGESGLRAKSGILTSAKETLKSDAGLMGYEGDGAKAYHLAEYGQLAMNPEAYESGNYAFVYGGEKAGVARCYYTDENGAVVDKLFEQKDGRDIFTNALTDLQFENYDQDFYFRSYVKLSSDDGNGGYEETILYGPIVGRSMYYVAEKLLVAPNASAMSDRVSNYLYEIRNGVAYDGGTVVYMGDSIMQGCNGANPRTLVGRNLPAIVQAKIKDTYKNTTFADQISQDTAALGSDSGGATWSMPGSCSPYNMLYYSKMINYNKSTNTYTGDDSKVKVVMIMAGLNDWHYQDQGQHGTVDGIYRTGLFGRIKSNGQYEIFENEGSYVAGNGYDYVYSDKADSTPAQLTGLNNTYSYSIFRTLGYLTGRFPNAKIVVCLPCKAIVNGCNGATWNNRQTFENLAGYAYRQANIANYYKNVLHKNVYVIDTYNGWTAPNFWGMFPDGAHPNQAGYDNMGAYIADRLIEILNTP